MTSSPSSPNGSLEMTETLTEILRKTQKFNSIKPTITNYLQQLTPKTIQTIISSKPLKSNPNTLLNFFKFTQTNTPNFKIGSLTTLPSFFIVLQTLFAHNKFPDAKNLLLDLIRADMRRLLLKTFVKPTRDLPKHSKAVLDTAIGAYVQCGYPGYGMIVFRRMKRLKLCPNLLTVNTLLNSLVKTGSTSSVLYCREVVNGAVKLGVVPNVNMFNILINGYCLENKFSDAKGLINEMREYGCVPDNVTYNTLLNALCKKGKLNDVRELLLDMKKQGLSPDRHTYNTLAHVYYERRGCLSEAMNVLDLMRQIGFLPDVWTYNTLISGLCHEGKVDEAISVRSEMEKLRLLPDVITYNTLIDGCFKWKKSCEAIELLNVMSERGIKRNEVTYNILIKWYCKECDLDKASETVKRMEASGYFPDSLTCDTLINGYCKTGDLREALKTMNEMSGRGFKINNYTVNTILRALCFEKKFDEAYELLQDTRKQGYIIDEVCYETLIVGYLDNEINDKAKKLWDELKEREKEKDKEREIVPGIISMYNSIVSGLYKSERHSKQ